MKIQKRLYTVVAMSFFLMAIAVGPALAAGMACDNLVNLSVPNTTITSAAVVTRTGPQPLPVLNIPVDVCRVVAYVEKEINFEVWMPVVGWNGNFNGVGNGALAGFINYEAMGPAVARGYATASTDTGHVGQPVPGYPPFPGFDASWALNMDTKELNMERLVNFGYAGTHKMTVAAKAIVEAYYGEGIKRSYFTGCSGGGQQGLAEAQRYPKDYIGIVAGAPANYPTHMWPGEFYPAILMKDMNVDDLMGKLGLIEAAVLAECDALDGLMDGLLDDPRRCDFDPAKLQCVGGIAPDCLTAKQVDVVQKIYAGLYDPFSPEKQIWPGFEASSELGWPSHLEPFAIQIGYFKYMVYKDPDWDWTTFEFDDEEDHKAYMGADALLGPILNAIEPDLSDFKEEGGKLIMYHGWIDQNIAPRNSISYYKSVMAAMGSEADTVNFPRLFMAPGMAHCGGGPGPNTFDALGALEEWVEKGIAPEKIIARKYVDDDPKKDVVMTRPLCPYPKVARYKGPGSIDDAQNFECVEIIPADVRIEPETLNLRSKGVFTAFITLPEGYEFVDFIAASCEGALAVRDNFSHQGRVYQVKFNRQDLINVKAGKSVPFTVTAIFERDGQYFAFEGTDRIRVGFGDVHPEHWADDQITAISNQGITAGCSTDPTFYCPDAAITRGQMAVFLVTSLGQSPVPCTGRFADVSIGDAFCGFVEQLAANGITGGCGGGKYCPNDPITRGQMAVFLEAALGNSANSCAGKFADVPVTHNFCGHIERLADDGITGGCGPGVFCPNNPVTRAEMAVFLVAAPPPLTP